MDSDEHDDEDNDDVGDTVTGTDLDDLEAWKEVHTNLLVAVRKAQEAVAIQKAQRRYWLEEIAWNLGDDGLLSSASTWKRPVPVKAQKASSGGTATSGPSKRKKKDTAIGDSLDCKPTKRPRKKKEGNDGAPPIKKSRKKKVELSASPAWSGKETLEPSFELPETSDGINDDADDERELLSASQHSSWDLKVSATSKTNAGPQSLPMESNDDTEHDEDEDAFDPNQPSMSSAVSSYPSYHVAAKAESPAEEASYHHHMPYGWLQEPSSSPPQYSPSDERVPKSASLPHPLSSATPRTYTSLQDIASDEDDDSDQDRF